MIKLRILRQGVDHGLSWWVLNIIPGVLREGDLMKNRRGESSRNMEAEVRMMLLQTREFW